MLLRGKMDEPDVFELSGGEVVVWADPAGSVMLKIVSSHGDPVELGEGEVDELIQVLTALRTKVT
jgi:hypothetical protein